jgi:hypothetical protein
LGGTVNPEERAKGAVDSRDVVLATLINRLDAAKTPRERVRAPLPSSVRAAV